MSIDSPAYSSLGRAIRDRRLELGLTQEELANRIGEHLSQSDISRIERGTIALPRRQRLEELAAALGIGLGDLLIRSGWLEDGNREALAVLQPGDGTANGNGIQAGDGTGSVDGHAVDSEIQARLVDIDARLEAMTRDIEETRQAIRTVMRALQITATGHVRVPVGVVRKWEHSVIFHC